ncbi:peptidase C65 Otubain-domain-containing protein, partial [Gorgonomyces haynaldii]
RPTDEEILRYERQIKEQQTKDTPLVSSLLDFSALEAEYENGELVYRNKIQHLKSTCLNMRTIKKDGNCFYRAFAFRLCELVRQHYQMPWYYKIVERAKQSRELMTTMGYDMSLLEDFWEPFGEILDKPEESEDKLLERFQTDYVSDTIVCYLRIVTAALLKRDRDLYEAFILDSFPTLEDFLATSVEPMGVESDQIHIVAMVNVFGIECKIANLDTTESSGINYHEISPMEPIQVDNAPSISLLYRPGHYDVLYPKPVV